MGIENAADRLLLGGWMLNAAKDFAMTYYKASIEAQKPTVPPPTPTTKNP